MTTIEKVMLTIAAAFGLFCLIQGISNYRKAVRNK